ncbi:MAG: SurA N-terminal domain-containing protein [Pseudomonadota bacterium]
MLMQIRDKATGVFAYIIVILIAIPFAFWGIQEYFTGPSDQNVAEVNGEELVKRAFDAQLQDRRSYLRSLYGTQAEENFGENDSKLKQEVLDYMIGNILINNEVSNAGYRTTDSRLFERISTVPQFQRNGRFDKQLYENFLAAQQRSPAEFESQMRNEDNVNQFQGSIIFSSFLPTRDKQQFAKLNKQKRDFDYFLITIDSQDIEVSDQEISDYYEANKESFQTPAQVKLEYLEIDQNKIADALEFSEDELMAVYEQDKSQFQTQELRKAKHILFKLPQDASEEEIDVALSKGQAALERLSSGEDFSDLAVELSEDQFSSNNGGDLGYLGRNDIDNPEFIQKLFSMNLGDTSHAIQTSLGVQIIQLDEITEPEQRSFEEARSYIDNSLRGDLAQEEFVKQAELLQELSYENEDSLEVPAEALGVEVQTTDWVSSQSAEGIGSFPKVITAAFSEDVLDNRFNSELLELSDGNVAVVRVAEFKEPQTQPLEEVSSVIRQIISFETANKQVAEAGNEAVKNLQSNATQAEAIASDMNVKLETSGALLRDDDSVPGEILDYAFTMRAPSEAQPIVDGLQLNNGDYAVVVLKEVQTPEDDAVVGQSEWISLQSNYGQREREATLNALRETADVRVYPENL